MKELIAYSIALILLCFGITQPSYAQERRHEVQGAVVDNFTGEALTPLMTLMTNDSTVIDTVRAEVDDYYASMGLPTEGFYNFPGVTERGKYIVKASLAGYEDAYMDFELRSSREDYVSVKKILMHKVHELGELVVRASKIKMVMCGDTIVYNADAFKLSEGSMLDALIARLPGAKLSDDGRIYVNGKFVENLLVNGQNFFSGSPKMALESLPAYTVSKIKVFNKSGQASKLMERNMNDDSFTMDVKLKKEYQTGYIGNIEAGIGTQSRYNLRGMGIKFTEKERIGIFSNLNNLNDNQRARLDGEWYPSNEQDGLLSTKNVGLSYMRFLKGNDSWVESSVNYEHQNSDNLTKQQTRTYLPSGDAYRNMTSHALSSADRLNLHNGFILYNKSNFSSTFLDVAYTKQKGWSNLTQSERKEKVLLSDLLSTNNGEEKNWNVNVKTENGIKLITDLLRIDAYLSYNRNEHRLLDQSNVTYHQVPLAADNRNNYIELPNQHLSVMGRLGYDYVNRKLTIKPSYQYTYTFNKAQNWLYRIDRLGGSTYDLDNLLPSVGSQLSQVYDAQNSYHYREHRNEHKFALDFHLMPSESFNKEIIVSLPVRRLQSKFAYDRTGQHDIDRKCSFFEPNIIIRQPEKWMITAGMESDFPEMTLLADYHDNRNPLRIQRGNSNLKNIHKYHVDGEVTLHAVHQQAFNVRLGYHQIDNAVAFGLVYNSQSSVATIRPVSVNGNWDVTGGIGYTRTLDKKGKLSLDNQLDVTYKNSVDMASTAGSLMSERSVVKNVIIGDNLKFNYHLSDNFDFTLHGNLELFHINSKRTGFEATHAGNYKLGFNTLITLPLNIQLTSDITMFLRRGYQLREMNSTDWVWNAQLSRSFVKGRLLAKLVMFDLLHQLNTTKYVVNEQGRTETWHNSIPRYVMLSLAWRFNVNPRKNK